MLRIIQTSQSSWNEHSLMKLMNIINILRILSWDSSSIWCSKFRMSITIKMHHWVFEKFFNLYVFIFFILSHIIIEIKTNSFTVKWLINVKQLLFNDNCDLTEVFNICFILLWNFISLKLQSDDLIHFSFLIVMRQFLFCESMLICDLFIIRKYVWFSVF